MSNELEVFFWTDESGNKRASYGNQFITPYDLSDGLNESKNNSIKDHVTDGKLDSDRYDLHNQIIQQYFDGHHKYTDGDDKVALFTGGGPASGKGGFVKNIDKYYTKNDDPVVIDADEVKKDLLKADTKNPDAKLDENTTGYYHEESSMLAKRLYEIAIKNNYPVMFDGTATGLGSLFKKLALAEKYGYRTEMCFMTADVNTVLNSSLKRFENTGRLVNLGFTLSAHKKAQTALPEIMKNVGSVKAYNRNGETISLMATGGKGAPQHITNQPAWDTFTKESAYSLDAGGELMFMQRVADISEKRKNG